MSSYLVLAPSSQTRYSVFQAAASGNTGGIRWPTLGLKESEKPIGTFFAHWVSAPHYLPVECFRRPHSGNLILPQPESGAVADVYEFAEFEEFPERGEVAFVGGAADYSFPFHAFVLA